MKQIRTLWKNDDTTSAAVFQFPEMNSREQTVSSAVALSACGQEDNIFISCCSTGEFLLDFQKIIITANLLLASLPTVNLSGLGV